MKRLLILLGGVLVVCGVLSFVLTQFNSAPINSAPINSAPINSAPKTPTPNEENQSVANQPESDPAPQNESNRPTGSQPISTSLTETRLQNDLQLLSPEQDGWKSEAFTEKALKQLDKLCGILVEETPSQQTLEKLVTADFACTDLRPKRLSTVFQDSMIVVRRAESEHQQNTKTGLSGLDDGFESLLDFLPARSNLHWHFKVVGVTPDQQSIATEVLVEMSSTDGQQSNQVNARWNCLWKERPGEQLQLKAIELIDYEEAAIVATDGKWFADFTSAVLQENRSLQDQFAFGHHYWLQRIERVQRFDTSVRNGLAIGDANGDGLDDVYVCQPGALPNRLLIHHTDGTATDRSAESGVDWLDQTSAALFCDLDNDGDQDLIIGTQAGILVMRNDSKGKFELAVTLDVDYDVQSLSAVDYDNDGLLDIFVCVYRTAFPAADQSFLYRDAVGGGLNRLFRNETTASELTFSDVTSSTGLDDGGDRYSMAASWEDYDNDGDQDLYIANDFGRNYLYENRNSVFVDVAEEAGITDIGSGMSVSWGDFNRDGTMDLYVGNMFSSAGKRVTQQRDFRATERPAIREIYQRLAKGNSLFTNMGNGTFREVGDEANVEMGRWAWSSLFVDLNNDGWEDVLVANGYMTTEDSGDL